MNENIAIVNLEELKERLISSLAERAIKVCTMKEPHTFLKAVGTHEIERILTKEFDRLKQY